MQVKGRRLKDVRRRAHRATVVVLTVVLACVAVGGGPSRRAAGQARPPAPPPYKYYVLKTQVSEPGLINAMTTNFLNKLTSYLKNERVLVEGKSIDFIQETSCEKYERLRCDSVSVREYGRLYEIWIHCPTHPVMKGRNGAFRDFECDPTLTLDYCRGSLLINISKAILLHHQATASHRGSNQ